MKYSHVSLLVILSFIPNHFINAQQNLDVFFNVLEVTELKDIPFNYASSRITIDNQDNFIVSDGDQGAFLIFNSEGNFVRRIGRSGRGPGEFEQLVHVEQLLSNNYLAVDLLGRLALFEPNGELIKTYSVPIIPLRNFIELDEESVLLPGKYQRDSQPTLLHKLNLKSGEIEKSFFEAPFEIGEYESVLPSMIKAVTDGDFIYAFITFLNNMYIYDLKGDFIRSVEDIEYEDFSKLEKEGRDINPQNVSEVLNSHSVITDLFMKKNQTIIIQYWQHTQAQTSEGYYGLAEINLNGEVIFEEKNTAQLFDVNNETGFYFFRDSLSLESEIQHVIKAKRNTSP